MYHRHDEKELNWEPGGVRSRGPQVRIESGVFRLGRDLVGGALSAVAEAVAVAVHLRDMDMVGEPVQHFTLGDHGDCPLVHMGALDEAQGIVLNMPALDQPVEEPVEVAVPGVDVALGNCLGVSGLAGPEPPGTFPKVGEVGCGVPVGGLQADYETSARLPKTEIRNLLDGHSSWRHLRAKAVILYLEKPFWRALVGLHVPNCELFGGRSKYKDPSLVDL